jgi:hypothetical protein
MVPRRLLIGLFGTAVLLPIATMVLFAAGRLLGSMQDAAGETVLVRISQATGVVWVLGLIALLLCLALETIGRSTQRPDEDR